MIDVIMTASVVLVLVMIIAALASTYPRAVRPLLWAALGEYLACAVAQYFFGLDATYYRQSGVELARALDNSFGWAAGELISLFFQKPSAFDGIILGAGTNTGSMSAATGCLIFVVGGSPYAAQALIAGLAMLGAIASYQALRDACPDISAPRLFAATVMFPSIAFWTASLHKEAFCLMGTGLLLSGWRAARKLEVRAILYAAVGVTLIALFRAPSLPPLLLGLVLHFVVSRIQKARGVGAAVVAPIYMGVGAAAIALGMALVSRLSPSLAIDELTNSIADHQRSWAMVEAGSSFNVDAPVATSLGGQVAMAPLGLLNALLRPQLFDVRNPLMLLSAVEMTGITWLIYRAVRIHGFGGLTRRIRSSPFLVMCLAVTVVGFTFVGLTTRNFGSLARYRVPFLPFYGALLIVLNDRKATGPALPGGHRRTSRGRKTMGPIRPRGAQVPAQSPRRTSSDALGADEQFEAPRAERRRK